MLADIIRAAGVTTLIRTIIILWVFQPKRLYVSI